MARPSPPLQVIHPTKMVLHFDSKDHPSLSYDLKVGQDLRVQGMCYSHCKTMLDSSKDKKEYDDCMNHCKKMV